MINARNRIIIAVFILSVSIAADRIVISSLRNARSFIYNSGDPLYVAPESDIWRICPLRLPTSQCTPFPFSTPACTFLSQDCRCYNFHIQTSQFIVERGNCIYVQITKDTGFLPLTWTLAYTYPVLPPGYTFYQHLLYRRLISPRTTFDDYAIVSGPLFCKAASAQAILFPILDECQYTVFLNLSYLPAAKLVFTQPNSVGPLVLVIVAFLLFGSYSFYFLRLPKRTTSDARRGAVGH